jgi:hypothetical protein
VTWDPQVQRALELIPRAETLLRDPRGYVAERARERQVTGDTAELRAQQ